MMEITFLGTGAGLPSKDRNVTAIMLNLLQEINELWMFDCGEATQHQILHTTLKPRKINKIFITHLHGDHIFGLPGLLSSRSFLGGDNDDVTIYGPKGIRQYVETSLQISGTTPAYTMHFVEIEKEGLLFEEEYFSVETVFLDHNIESIGYKIIEKDKLGELNVQKLKEQGIQPGPIYRDIKDNPTVTLDDGTVIKREDFIGPPKLGRTIVIFGDTRYMPEHISFVENADVLVHEATFAADSEDLAMQYYHTTTAQAATFAKNAKVKQLILTHISSRYQKEALECLQDEAASIFPNVLITHDFYTYKLK